MEYFPRHRGLSQIVPGAHTASKNYYLSHIILLTVWAPGTICESPIRFDNQSQEWGIVSRSRIYI